MSKIFAVGAPLALAVSLGLAASQAAAGIYVSNDLPDVKPEAWVKNPRPQPVQLFVEFQTNGAANARATKFVKDAVVQTVKSSALFSDVADQATPNGALLHVVINDLADAKARGDAESKGFATGLTLGLVGNTVAESYECTVDYAAGPAADKISKSVHHKLYIQVGMTAPTPANATKAASVKEAVFTLVRQCTANPLNALAAEPAFLGAAPTPTPTPATAAGPAASTPAAPASNPAASAPAAPTPNPAPATAVAPAPGTSPKAPDAPAAPQEPHA